MKAWAKDDTPRGIGDALFTDDLECFEPNMLRAIDGAPVAGRAGIWRGFGSPIIWTPDSTYRFGSVPKPRHHFCFSGIIPGFSQSNSLRLLSLERIVTGWTNWTCSAWSSPASSPVPARPSPRPWCALYRPARQFTGDLGRELHCAGAVQARRHAALQVAGRVLGLGPIGSLALMSLRVEEGFGPWGGVHSPADAGDRSHHGECQRG
jgi:hypothetical protein